MNPLAGDRPVLEFDRRRDESSFRALYQEHTPMIFALATRLCGSRTEAEELTQETWLRAVEHHARFDGRSKYSTWLVGITINCFREAARRHAKRPGAVEDVGEGQVGKIITPAFPPPRPRAEPMDVERALTQLPGGYREVVILHDINGYTHKEIASMLEIEEGTSKSQLTRGRRRLRELLNPPSSQERDQRGAP